MSDDEGHSSYEEDDTDYYPDEGMYGDDSHSGGGYTTGAAAGRTTSVMRSDSTGSAARFQSDDGTVVWYAMPTSDVEARISSLVAGVAGSLAV